MNQLYLLDQITADLIASTESHPPVCRAGFYFDRSASPQITTGSLSDYDAYLFESARIWLRNFSPVRDIAEKRRFQWGSYQASGHSISHGMFLLAAHSLGFKPIHYETALSREVGFQILLLDVDSGTVREFFRHSTHLIDREYDVLEANPRVQAALAEQKILEAKIIAELAD